MRFLLSLALLTLTAALASAARVGETYDQVISEKGKPADHLEAGAMQILTYPDAIIKLKDGVVIAIKAPAAAVAASPNPPPSAPVARPRPAADAPAEDRGPAAWTTDYMAALNQARAENKHVFLFFTGSDWCGWCMKLNREILQTADFNRFAQDKLVLVELDFPKQKPQPPEVRTQNRMLAQRFKIQGYPTVIVLDANGTPVGRLGYQPGGPQPFVSQLAALGD